jgi:hypothetical protein
MPISLPKGHAAKYANRPVNKAKTARTIGPAPAGTETTPNGSKGAAKGQARIPIKTTPRPIAAQILNFINKDNSTTYFLPLRKPQNNIKTR